MAANNNPGPVTVLQSTQNFSLLALDILNKLAPELEYSSEVDDNVLNALVAEKAPVPHILEIMAEFHDRLNRRE